MRRRSVLPFFAPWVLLVCWTGAVPALAQETEQSRVVQQARPEEPVPAEPGETAQAVPEQERQPAPRRPLPRRVPPRIAEGETVSLGPPALTTETGPLFPLRRVADRLGGILVDQEGSVALRLGGEQVIAGPDNPVMLVGREVVELSESPVQGVPGVQGLLVPLDFLRRTYGELAGFDFAWSPEEDRLTARLRQPQTLPVTVDVVHLQGVSTVVLRFPERFDYEVVERGEDREVHATRDRFEAPRSGARVRDPLVHEVRVSPGRVRLDLAPGTSAESYTLEDPFRLVFDVVEEERAAATLPNPDQVPGVERRVARDGVHTIVIDPGHGGAETGAVGPGGHLEKELSLELARSLQARLRERLPVKVVLTRDEDASLPHDTRTAIANRNKADLFVSIHLNSSLGSTAHGAETYFLSMEASDDRAARAARIENRSAAEAEAEAAPGPRSGADGSPDPMDDLQLILWDLAQSHHLSESQRVASLIQEELNGALGIRNRGVKQAPFRVLMGAAMPAVLVELGFLSNPEEESKLTDPGYRERLVEALVRAIGRYRSEAGDRAARQGSEPAAAPAEPGP
ncbi:MAG: N-acetylmuramoyl-L-alanine amidase [Thermoanaerobaculia bacterium]